MSVPPRAQPKRRPAGMDAPADDFEDGDAGHNGIVDLFGLHLQDASLASAAARLSRLAIRGQPARVFFVNAHCVNVAARDRTYLDALRSGDLLYADGIGMAIAARLRGSRLQDNVNGTDLFPLLCGIAAARAVPLAFLGARPGVAERCADRMRERFPGLRIVWTGHGYHPGSEDARIIDGINASGARMLFVAKGVPAQELWIAAHAPRIAAPVVLGVGALFDFYSGAIPRCPLLLRALRLEWLFRLGMEPRRLFTRYVLGNPAFLYRAIRQARLG